MGLIKQNWIERVKLQKNAVLVPTKKTVWEKFPRQNNLKHKLLFFTDKKQKKRPDVGEIKFLKNCLFESTLRIRMTHQHSFDTDCITLIRFVLSEQKKHPNAQGFLTQLLTSIQSAVKVCKRSHAVLICKTFVRQHFSS